MSWEEQLLGLFEDLEQQADALARAERDAEVAEQVRAEYAAVELAARFHASVGAQLQLRVSGVGRVSGRLARAGRDWCLVESETDVEWLLRLAAVATVRGLSERAVTEPARPVQARLGLGSALRGVAAEAEAALFTTLEGAEVRGRIRRVGADFVEVVADGSVTVVAFAHLAAVRR